MHSSQLYTLPLRLWTVPLSGYERGDTCLSVFYIISAIIVQIHPSPHLIPTFLVPTIPEQWCSNKAIPNDEHTFIPPG